MLQCWFFFGFMWSTRRDKKCIQKKLVCIKKRHDIPLLRDWTFRTKSRIWDEFQVRWKHDAVLRLTQPVHWNRSWAVINGFGVGRKNYCFDTLSSGPVSSNISLLTQGQQKQNTSFAFISYLSPALPLHSQYGCCTLLLWPPLPLVDDSFLIAPYATALKNRRSNAQERFNTCKDAEWSIKRPKSRGNGSRVHHLDFRARFAKIVISLTFVSDDPQILAPFATAPHPPKATPGDCNPCRQGQSFIPE